MREELHTHNHNYYILNAPTISDQEFDRLMREPAGFGGETPRTLRRELAERARGQRPEQGVPPGGTQVSYALTGQHVFRDRGAGVLRTCAEGTERGLRNLLRNLKFDGTSISLTYEDGRLVQAVTRGDGVRGDDVTDNVKTIRSIPLRLSGEGYPRRFEIRGEILMPWTVFEELNRERELREEPLLPTHAMRLRVRSSRRTRQ